MRKIFRILPQNKHRLTAINQAWSVVIRNLIKAAVAWKYNCNTQSNTAVDATNFREQLFKRAHQINYYKQTLIAHIRIIYRLQINRSESLWLGCHCLENACSIDIWKWCIINSNYFILRIRSSRYMLFKSNRALYRWQIGCTVFAELMTN